MIRRTLTRPSRRGLAVLGVAAITGMSTVLAPAAYAGTSNTTLGVTATVTVTPFAQVAATPVAFPSYASGSMTPVTASGTVTVVAANNEAYSINLDNGITGVANGASSRLLAGGTSLHYNLYTDAALTHVWGTNMQNGVAVSGVGNGSAQGYTVYGNLPALQTAQAGNASDTITVTVSF